MSECRCHEGADVFCPHHQMTRRQADEVIGAASRSATAPADAQKLVGQIADLSAKPLCDDVWGAVEDATAMLGKIHGLACDALNAMDRPEGPAAPTPADEPTICGNCRQPLADHPTMPPTYEVYCDRVASGEAPSVAGCAAHGAAVCEPCAAAAEREACARIADVWVNSASCVPGEACEHQRLAYTIACRIRQRAEATEAKPKPSENAAEVAASREVETLRAWMLLAEHHDDCAVLVYENEHPETLLNPAPCTCGLSALLAPQGPEARATGEES